MQQHILVVDDESVVRKVVVASLERAGLTATSAAGADEALGMLRSGSIYDVVMSDIMMPGIDGLALLDNVARDFPETR